MKRTLAYLSTGTVQHVILRIRISPSYSLFIKPLQQSLDHTIISKATQAQEIHTASTVHKGIIHAARTPTRTQTYTVMATNNALLSLPPLPLKELHAPNLIIRTKRRREHQGNLSISSLCLKYSPANASPPLHARLIQ